MTMSLRVMAVPQSAPRPPYSGIPALLARHASNRSAWFALERDGDGCPAAHDARLHRTAATRGARPVLQPGLRRRIGPGRDPDRRARRGDGAVARRGRAPLHGLLPGAGAQPGPRDVHGLAGDPAPPRAARGPVRRSARARPAAGFGRRDPGPPRRATAVPLGELAVRGAPPGARAPRLVAGGVRDLAHDLAVARDAHAQDLEASALRRAVEDDGAQERSLAGGQALVVRALVVVAL